MSTKCARLDRGQLVFWRRRIAYICVFLGSYTLCALYFEIARDPAICGGEPVVRGTRVTVRTILASLAEGAWIDEILAGFPTLTEAQARAVIAFAAASAEEV
ncbi:MAG: DUF433 domain-containing protein [Caldilinea sp.]